MYSILPATIAVAGAFTLGIAGCATKALPPTDQMTVARASVSGANAAGAQMYAPGELKLANDKFALAQKAMLDKDYHLALQSAEQAHADAQLAVARTQAAKARQAADDAQAAARAVRVETDRNARRPGPGVTQ
jgi:hypothetical protein